MMDAHSSDRGFSGDKVKQHIYSVLRNVAEDYICLIDVDLQTEREVRYDLRGREFGGLPDWCGEDNYSTAIKDYAQKIVCDTDRARFLRTVELPALMDVLRTQKEFVIEYGAVLGGNMRCFQGRFTCGSGENGGEHLFVGIRDVTETRRYEAQSRRLIENSRHRQAMDAAQVTDRRTILVVESSGEKMEELGLLLRAEYHLVRAENSREGMDILEAEYQNIAAVLLDADAPGENCRRFLTSLTEDPLLNLVPVITVSWTENAAMEERCLQLGAVSHVVLPDAANMLLRRVSSVIRLREKAASLAASEFDSLTGLLTREAFYHHAELMLRRNPHRDYSILVSDIEDFKKINERYGVEAANNVLIKTAEYFKQGISSSSLSGRLQGDRFVCMFEHGTQSRGIELLEESISEVGKELPIAGMVLKFGLYKIIDRSQPISVCCDRAVMALHTVKHRFGEVLGRFTPELQKTADRQRRIEESMQEAYHTGQFCVYYQPQIDSLTGHVIGAEALIRWNHPEYGFMSPAEFIPLFERNGFITMADYYVLQRTCKNLRRWMDGGLDVVPISINASRLDFCRPEFLDRVDQLVEENGIFRHLLHLEVTESSFSDNADAMIAMLTAFRKRGYQVELDDFGSGYSTLNALCDLPLDVVKLDRLFIRQVSDPRKKSVLHYCTALAKNLHLRTVAEGVETEEQLELVRNAGVNSVQGFYYSRPLPENEFEEYIRTHRTGMVSA